MLDYLWLIPLFPLLGFLINGLLGRRLGERGARIVGPTVVGVSFVLSVLAFLELLGLPAEERVVQNTLYTWIAAGRFEVSVSFLLDPLSAVMILVVTGVGFLIHIYSAGYMHGDRGFARFFAFLNLFTFAMLLLVLADNFLLLFVGWEGVGLCSYLLIGFWYEDSYNAYAGRKAFVVNRVGDFGFLIALFLIVSVFGSLNYDDVFRAVSEGQGLAAMTAITLLLFVGATGKSAQIPLYVWLPDAMAGPTPVSALIHAATMVTAGVYMVARASVMFLQSPITMAVVAAVGAATALYSATIALTNNDIKRVLAYSTISQLGYMFLATGVGAFAAGIFHLMTHAFFKALLFLSAGSVMHAVANETDMRKMGGLKKKLPVTYISMLTGALALAGIPIFSGFFSKDEILWMAAVSRFGGFGFWLVGALAAGLTAFYIFRLIYLTFHGESRLDPEVARHVHESPRVMTIPLMLLAVLSLVGGWVGIPHLFTPLDEFLEPVFSRYTHLEIVPPDLSFGLELSFMGISVAIALLGIGVAYLMYLKNPALPGILAARFAGLYRLLYNKYYIDEIYNALIVRPIAVMSDLLFWRVIDMRLVDGAVNGVAALFGAIGQYLRRLQTGAVQAYALSLLLGAVVLIFYYLLS
jgi:NADH-quinone oxidoreductase subunit L